MVKDALDELVNSSSSISFVSVSVSLESFLFSWSFSVFSGFKPALVFFDRMHGGGEVRSDDPLSSAFDSTSEWWWFRSWQRKQIIESNFNVRKKLFQKFKHIDTETMNSMR